MTCSNQGGKTDSFVLGREREFVCVWSAPYLLESDVAVGLRAVRVGKAQQGTREFRRYTRTQSDTDSNE